MIQLSTKIQLLCFLAFIIDTLTNAQQTPAECSSQKGLWFSKKYPYSDELMKLSVSKTANVCAKPTCCDNIMQNEMVAVSRLKLKSIGELHLKEIIGFLSNHSDSLNDFFLHNLDSSRNQLNQMFLNTYSTNYKSNQPFFFEFYDKLKQYMIGKEQNVEKILENFFQGMAERILHMMVVGKRDPETIRCLTNNFLKLDPFENIDKAIIASFRRAYPTARMTVNSMKAAHDVFVELMGKKMTPSLECAEDHAKAFHCSLCSMAEIRPCEDLCKSIMGKCFGSLNSKEMNKLNRSWKKLLVALKKTTDKLRHPFNYPEINKNLHVKISDAIMTVHNFYPNVRDKISGNCKNQITRRRRSENGNFQQSFDTIPRLENNMQLKSQNLIEIVEKLTAKIPNMTQHLQKAKITICSKLTLPAKGKQCWNGSESTTSYKAGSKDKSQNKNLSIDPVVQSSINKLNEITMTLNDLLTEKNRDPNAFKIKYIEKPKIVEVPRSRSSRISESIEGSGNGDRENINVNPNPNPNLNTNVNPNSNPNPNIKVKPEMPVIAKEKPSETIEGSGSKKSSPNNNQNTKDRPAFPEIPVTGDNQPSNTPMKKPSIPDDEDLAPVPNEKEKITNQFEGRKAPIEGSGAVDSFDKSTERLKVTTPTTTTITTTLPPVIETKKPVKEFRVNKENSLPEGSGHGSDDEPPRNRPDDYYSKSSVINGPPTTIPSVDEAVTTVGVLLPNELPGVIPNEIWIPRVVDYDSYGKIVSQDNEASTNIHYGWLSMVLSHVTLLISVYLYH